MGQTCKTCHHPSVQEIDKALLAGQPYRSVANQYEASPSSVYRHQQDHLPAALVKASEVAEIAHGNTLLEQLQGLQARASGILEAAERAGDLRTALSGVKEIRGTLELVAKLTGELVNRHEVNVNYFTIEHHIRAIYAEMPLEALERRVDRLHQLLASGEVTEDTAMSADELWGPNGKGRVVDGAVVEDGG